MRNQTAATSAVVRNFPHDRRSDADLVRDVAHGEEGALAAVWRRHASRVRRTLLAQLGNDSAVDDLLQEIFFAFSQNARRITQPEKLLSYLMAAAVRQARQVMRNRMRQRRWLGRWADERRDDAVHPAVDGRDAVRTLRRVLDQLPERLRETFVLRFVEELSVLEVAELRGVSIATVKRDISRSQQKVLTQAEREPALLEYLRAAARDRAMRPGVEQLDGEQPDGEQLDGEQLGTEQASPAPVAAAHTEPRPTPGDHPLNQLTARRLTPGNLPSAVAEPESPDAQPSGPRHCRVGEEAPQAEFAPTPASRLSAWEYRSRATEAPPQQAGQQDRPAAQSQGKKERP